MFSLHGVIDIINLGVGWLLWCVASFYFFLAHRLLADIKLMYVVVV